MHGMNGTPFTANKTSGRGPVAENPFKFLID
jgi:hypothetical protein